MNESLVNYSVLYLNSIGKDNKSIAKELDIKLSQVKKILSSQISKNSTETTQKNQTAKDLIINQTSGKGNKTVSIMTKAASELSDATRKNNQSTESRTLRNAIYRPRQ